MRPQLSENFQKTIRKDLARDTVAVGRDGRYGDGRRTRARTHTHTLESRSLGERPVPTAMIASRSVIGEVFSPGQPMVCAGAQDARRWEATSATTAARRRRLHRRGAARSYTHRFIGEVAKELRSVASLCQAESAFCSLWADPRGYVMCV